MNCTRTYIFFALTYCQRACNKYAYANTLTNIRCRNEQIGFTCKTVFWPAMRLAKDSLPQEKKAVYIGVIGVAHWNPIGAVLVPRRPKGPPVVKLSKVDPCVIRRSLHQTARFQWCRLDVNQQTTRGDNLERPRWLSTKMIETYSGWMWVVDFFSDSQWPGAIPSSWQQHDLDASLIQHVNMNQHIKSHMSYHYCR